MTFAMSTKAMGITGALLLVLGVVSMALIALARRESPVRIAWARYEAALEREARFLVLPQSGKKLAQQHVLAVIAAFILPFILNTPEFLVFVPVAIFAPYFVLESRHRERVMMIEEQLAPWLRNLSGTLKSTPALGDAIGSSASHVRAPLAEELDRMLKEYALGTPLDKALINLSERISSATVSSALATILIGRQTGGDMSTILESSASTLEEMARLEGVVRTKTAEGKSQAMVLGAMPFVVIAGLYMVDPDWLTPLFTSVMGKMIIFGAFLLWAGAIALALRILQVDI